VIDLSIGLDADMIKGRVVEVQVLVGIKCYADGWKYSGKSHPFTTGSYAGADRLENEYHAICSGITATEKYIEPEIETAGQVDLVAVPNTTALEGNRLGESITVTGVLLGRTVKNILRESWME
jgi:hypothetical protein